MKILIIQQKMIGDVLTTSVLFEAIKRVYPKSELHYVINSHTFPVVENNPFIDKVVFITDEIQKSKLQFCAFLKQIKKENYDVVLDVYSKFSSNLITLFSGAKTRISKHKSYTSLFYNHTFEEFKTPKTIAGLAIENRLELLRPIDIFPEPTECRPKIYLTQDEKESAKSFLISNGIDLNKPLFMISVLGSGETKTYPYVYMAQVIDGIVEQKQDAQLLFNYIPKQETQARSIYELCKNVTKSHIYFDVFGKGLRDFLAITSHCDALIGNEGGAVNMAKAINIPTFTIFSPWIKKEAWSLFDDGKTHVSVHLKDFKSEFYKQVEHPKSLKSDYKSLYEAFTPNLILPELGHFLKQF